MSKQDYVTRISSATPLQLVVVTYDLILEEVGLAKGNMGNSDIQEHVSKAQQLLSSLITSLDMEIEISKQLLDIYLYVNKLFISCNIKLNIKGKDEEVRKMLMHAEQILNNLLVGWKNIEDNDNQSVMPSSQQVYAGLTYKNGKLSEYIDENIGRSFKA